jgi:hypothetical protein
MNKRITYLIFGVLLLTLRLIFNFKFELIPGINGGYYPLQVKTLLDTGHLGFSDMPLYFYINAFFVKIVTFFTIIDIDQLIIYTSKIIDSISLPLLVVPLYLINKNVFGNNLSKYFEIFLIGFATLSFSPLILTSDLQKNAFAIPLMLFFIYFLLLFYKEKSKKSILLSAVFIILIGLSHFGVFSISVLILITSLIFFYRKKAIFPILGISILGILLVLLFDSNRSDRLFNLCNLIFEKPVILQGILSPPDLVNYGLSYLLIIVGFYYIIKRKAVLSSFKVNVLASFLFVVFILSFPLIDLEYAKRFSLLLFIPQIIILFILFDFLNESMRIMISALLVLITIVSVFLMTGNIKPPSITQEAFQDLKNLEEYISEPDETLIIARHGLEWWTAWQLRTKVGQDKSVNRNTTLKYEKVIKLEQLNGINQMHPQEKSPFHEPYFPSEQEAIYVSDYFRATELKKEDLEKIEQPAGNNVYTK